MRTPASRALAALALLLAAEAAVGLGLGDGEALGPGPGWVAAAVDPATGDLYLGSWNRRTVERVRAAEHRAGGGEPAAEALHSLDCRPVHLAWWSADRTLRYACSGDPVLRSYDPATGAVGSLEVAALLAAARAAGFPDATTPGPPPRVAGLAEAADGALLVALAPHEGERVMPGRVARLRARGGSGGIAVDALSPTLPGDSRTVRPWRFATGPGTDAVLVVRPGAGAVDVLDGALATRGEIPVDGTAVAAGVVGAAGGGASLLLAESTGRGLTRVPLPPAEERPVAPAARAAERAWFEGAGLADLWTDGEGLAVLADRQGEGWIVLDPTAPREAGASCRLEAHRPWRVVGSGEANVIWLVGHGRPSISRSSSSWLRQHCWRGTTP